MRRIFAIAAMLVCLWLALGVAPSWGRPHIGSAPHRLA